jgi:hypothetical protein
MSFGHLSGAVQWHQHAPRLIIFTARSSQINAALQRTK